MPFTPASLRQASSPAAPLLSLGLAALLLGWSGCMSATDHRNAVNAAVADRLTLGTIQKEIRQGMSSAEVVTVLGAPNLVTTDDQRREVWVYDKAAREVIHSASGLQLIPLLLSTGSIAGGATGGIAQSAGASAQSDRTLTVVIKFDTQQKVRDWAYHASQF
jgi:outer membrane protein assembly factor BamE (lipoprotein component of BamABCDE complex)